MEHVEERMKGLNLSELENKGLRIGWSDGKKVGSVEPRAIAKLLSDRPAHAEAMAEALGPIWCPMKGVTCRDRGDNIFMFTFHQESGKNKALFEGPWMFNKSLLVIEDFEPTKTVKEYEFTTIPIWVRMFGLPLGMMDRDTGESIGDEIGKFMEADVDDDGLAKGKYLRVKVRINIKRPLMRGIMLNVGEGKDGLWSRFEYEYLPDFCYICGMLDHINKDCKIILAKGEKAQFGSWLKAFIPRQNNDHFRGVYEGGRAMSIGHGSGKTGRYGFHSFSNKSRSDNESWRIKSAHNLTERISGKDNEANNPTQLNKEKCHSGEKGNMAEKQLLLEGRNKELEGKDKGTADGSVIPSSVVNGGESNTTFPSILSAGNGTGLHVPVHVDQRVAMLNKKQGVKEQKTYVKKQRKGSGGGNQANLGVQVGKKRGCEPMEVEENISVATKKVKVVDSAYTSTLAGLSE
jgi:hypothetical protein